MTAALQPQPGQIWRHIGFEGPYGVVPATGLRVRVLRREEGQRQRLVCDYPDLPSKGERRYWDEPWLGYELETEDADA